VVEQAEDSWLACHSEPRSGEESREAEGDPASIVEFDYFSLGGLALMERLIGYDRAVLVDAIQTRGGEPGAIYRLTLDDLPTLHANSAHDASLKAALALGRQLGARLPGEIVIYAIEATNVLDFGESLSRLVAASVPRAAGLVVGELANNE
jgi:hydrogenase maturation protease